MVSSLAKRLLELHRRAPCSGTSVPPSEIPSFEFVQAVEWPDVEAAYRLIYRCYLAKGLIRPNPAAMRYTHYNLLPESATFVAKAGDRVVATFSLIADTTRFGLPMDELYGTELQGLRSGGRRLAEISGLAVDPEFSPLSVHLIMNLVKLLYTYARKLGRSDLVVACHPKHASLYRRLYLFEQFGGFRTYRAVNDAPAFAVRLDLDTVKARYQAAYDAPDFNLYRFFFSDEVFRCPAAALRASAYCHEVNKRLCENQRAVVDALEAGLPGLVHRLTGQPPTSIARGYDADGDLGWETSPIFVAA